MRMGFWLFLALALAQVPGAALSSEATLRGEEIRAMIIGNTVEGTFSSGSRYRIFFTQDGSIRAEGFFGSWTISGDELCLDFKGTASDACRHIALNGDALDWIEGDRVVSSGTLVSGNPYGL